MTEEFTYVVNASYVEIYNENIKDLLNPNKREYLELRDDPNKGLVIAGVTTNQVKSIKDLMRLLVIGNSRRTTESTKANSESSRSHAVLQVMVTKKPLTANYKYQAYTGKLSMIDLAGSERGTVTENRGLRLREGAKINRSLLALANCINALGDKSKKGTFVPYRDSKLTRMLKDSLGGNSKTLMMCNISPASSQFEETLNTLKYASRARKIKTRPKENKRLVELHIAEYKNIIADLKNEISDLRQRALMNTLSKTMNSSERCDECHKPYNTIKENIKDKIDELTELFSEQMQVRKQIYEIEAQNKLNRLEILKDKELAKTQNGINTDLNIEIANLESSMDFNSTIQTDKKSVLAKLTRNTETLLDEIQRSLTTQDATNIIDELIKNKMVEIENLQYETNLKMYEEYNFLLMRKIKQMHSLLSDYNIDYENSSSEDEAEDTYDVRNINDNNYELEPEKNIEDHLGDELNRHSAVEEIPGNNELRGEEFDKQVEGIQSQRSLQFQKSNKLKKIPPREEPTPSFNYSKTFERPETDSKDKSNFNERPSSPQFGQSTLTGNPLFPEAVDTLKTDPNLELNDSKDEIEELEEMGFDMGEYAGTLKSNDASYLDFGISQNPYPEAKSHMFTMEQKDITKEIQNLERLSKLDIKKSKINAIDRSSTVRIEREKNQKVDWNMVVNWGDEWELYDGGIYPETTLTLEGDLIVDEKDFEDCLTPQELNILRKLEVGEPLDNIQEYSDDDEF